MSYEQMQVLVRFFSEWLPEMRWFTTVMYVIAFLTRTLISLNAGDKKTLKGAIGWVLWLVPTWLLLGANAIWSFDSGYFVIWSIAGMSITVVGIFVRMFSPWRVGRNSKRGVLSELK